MDVTAPSVDTLFIRGFSTRTHIDDIRAFFTREGGRHTIELHKDAPDGENIFLALKFESKSAAKDVISRYHNAEVLGNRISIVWYRKSAYYDRAAYRRGPASGPWSSEGRYYAVDRSGQFSRNRSGVPYYGALRNTTYYPRGSGPSVVSNRPRRRTTLRSSSRSNSSHSKSRSHSSSAGRGSHSPSADSHGRTRKRRRSTSDSTRRHSTKQSRKNKSRSSASLDRAASVHSENDASPTPASYRTKKKGSSSLDRTPNAENALRTTDTAHSDVEGLSDDGPHTPPPAVGQEQTKPPRAVLRSTVTTVGTVRKVTGPRTPSEPDASYITVGSSELGEPAGGNDIARKTLLNAGDAFLNKKLRDDQKPFEDELPNEHDSATAEKVSVPVVRRLPLGLRDDVLNDEFFCERPNKPLMRDALPTDVEPVNSNSPLHASLTSKKRKLAATGQEELELQNGGQLMMQDGGILEGGFGDDVGFTRRRHHPFNSSLSSNVRGHDVTMKKWTSNLRDSGALGLPPEKMGLVREKKEDIEKAYRQDCETFATVTKMLISKDPGLEDRIQFSLRENLKEIGKRCIHELRNFIDGLKSEQDEECF